MSSVIKTSALKACRHFMLPIARFLLKHGVGYREFSEISKLAFVQVASEDYGIRGRRTNMSRISVMTGLNRKEIRRIRDRIETEDWELDPNLSKPTHILAEWFTSKTYVGPRGVPKALPYEEKDGRASFVGLVKEIGGDIPPGAMLKELIRAGCVKETRAGVWKAVKRQYTPRVVDVFLVQRFGECLHDLAETMSSNMEQANPDDRLFEFRAWANGVDKKSTPKLRKMVALQGQAYLESIDDWLGEHVSKNHEPPPGSTVRCGVGVYYFESPVTPNLI